MKKAFKETAAAAEGALMAEVSSRRRGGFMEMMTQINEKSPVQYIASKTVKNKLGEITFFDRHANFDFGNIKRAFQCITQCFRCIIKLSLLK